MKLYFFTSQVDILTLEKHVQNTGGAFVNS